MLKRGSQMNPDVARSAVQLKKQKETKAAVAMAVKNVKCSQLFVLLVEKNVLFLFNHLVTNLYIAVSALYPQHVATGKSFIVKNFPGLLGLGSFFVLVRLRLICIKKLRIPM